MRKARFAALGAALAVAMAGAVPAVAQDDVPEAIKVGAVVPLTGAFAGGGAQVERGYRYGSGGHERGRRRLRRRVRRRCRWSWTFATTSRTPTHHGAAWRICYSEDMVAYLGGFASPVHAAGTVIAEKNQIPYLGVATALQALHEQGYEYYFSLPQVAGHRHLGLRDAQRPATRGRAAHSRRHLRGVHRLG